jgi:shikimate dehydrogenase
MTTLDRPDLHARFLLAGVIGWPVSHSRSPLMHNHWLQVNGLKGAYLPLAVEPGRVEAALRGLPALGFVGCNVTIPHKQEAMRLVDELHDSARAIGAISCVTVRPDGSLSGSNNDAFGFIRNLRATQPGWRPDAGPAVVMGAGGGARAVCWGLLREGVPEVRLVNRTRERAEAVAQALAGTGAGTLRVVDWSDRADALEGAALLVNTTSQGMVGREPLDLPLDRLPTAATVADIVYVPMETPLLAAARSRGNPTVGGLGMLLHQGPLAWQAWCGFEPAVTDELRQLIELSL